jgi:hypothetical protein
VSSISRTRSVKDQPSSHKVLVGAGGARAHDPGMSLLRLEGRSTVGGSSVRASSTAAMALQDSRFSTRRSHPVIAGSSRDHAFAPRTNGQRRNAPSVSPHHGSGIPNGSGRSGWTRRFVPLSSPCRPVGRASSRQVTAPHPITLCAPSAPCGEPTSRRADPKVLRGWSLSSSAYGARCSGGRRSIGVEES